LKFIPDLKNRSTELEFMDNIECDKMMLFQTLSDFAFVNKWLSRSRYLINRFIINDIKEKQLSSVSIVDIGSGGGDIPLWLYNELNKNKISAQIYCLDNDERCIEYSSKKLSKYNNIKILKLSAFELDTIQFPVHYIFANHFLHHIETNQISEILCKINNKALFGFLINDLSRSYISYAAYSLLRPLFSKDSFTYEDGLLSICKGFKNKELHNLIKVTDIHNSKVFRIMPGRCVITNL
jgi:2-polyprenyl-3-methyl-5-hydroxy-6-metoxy-1,4-benzoquinol methylase